jgi:hypothetical protein
VAVLTGKQLMLCGLIYIYSPAFRRSLLPPLLSGLNKRYHSEEGKYQSREDHTPENRNTYFFTLLTDFIKDCLSHANPGEIQLKVNKPFTVLLKYCVSSSYGKIIGKLLIGKNIYVKYSDFTEGTVLAFD